MYSYHIIQGIVVLLQAEAAETAPILSHEFRDSHVIPQEIAASGGIGVKGPLTDLLKHLLHLSDRASKDVPCYSVLIQTSQCHGM